jgi:hypothetical protein
MPTATIKIKTGTTAQWKSLSINGSSSRHLKKGELGLEITTDGKILAKAGIDNDNADISSWENLPYINDYNSLLDVVTNFESVKQSIKELQQSVESIKDGSSGLIFKNKSSFPSIGNEKNLYIDTDEDKIYRFNSSTNSYVMINRATNDVIQEYDSYLEFPTLGDSSKIYVDTTKDISYRWDYLENKYYSIGNDFERIKVIDGGSSLN